MSNKVSENKIEIDDLTRGLYDIHMKRKNYRICNVIRVLVLREDFQPFLQRLQNEAIHEVEVTNAQGQKIVIWRTDFRKAPSLISQYISTISDSLYFNNKGASYADYFSYISSFILEQSYVDGYANDKNRDKDLLFGGVIMIDDSQNYPNITRNIFDQESFWKVFEDAFYGDAEHNKKIEEKYGQHPSKIIFGGNTYDELPKGHNIEMARPKICQLVFDDTTEKGELIDYINKEWSTISGSLKALRPSRDEKRITTSKNFFRDVDIFNKYQEYKNEGYKNPDVKVYSWLKNNSDYKIEIEPNTVRKIVSLLKSEVDEINMDK
jgi:hypothetical protein